MSLDHLFADLPRGKYEPVLDVHRRSQILALSRRGISASVLSAHYGVNRHTVHSICRDASKHYRAVRAEYAALGREAYEAKYLDESLVRLVLAQQRGDVEERQGLRQPFAAPTHFNRRATAQAGRHEVQDVNGFPLSVSVEWCQPIDGLPEAWYYKEGEADYVGPYYTSTLALDGARQGKTQGELDDKRVRRDERDERLFLTMRTHD